MTSTRNKNLMCDYKLQQKNKEVFANHILYPHFGQATTNHSPGFNVLSGQVGPSTLSSNFADIDSFLKGTYQNNLVDPRPVLKAQLKEQVPLNFFHRSQVFLPEPVDEKSCYRPHLV
jgi:hypothetical protein